MSDLWIRFPAPARWRGPAPDRVLVALAAVVAFAWFAIVLWVRALRLQTRAFDQAFFQQVSWNLDHGRGFVTNFAPGSALAVHFSPFLVVPAAAELVWTDPRALSLLNALGLAAVAPAFYLFLRALLPDRPAATWLACALAIAAPFLPAIQEAARADFHPESLALPLALVAAAAGLAGRRRTFWGLTLAVMSVKEDQAYTALVLGLLIAVRPGPLQRDGRKVAVVALAYGAAMFTVVLPALALLTAPAGHAQLLSASYYGWMTHASVGQIASAFFRPEAWARLAELIFGLGGLALLRPRWLLLVLPPFLGDLMSQHYPQMLLHLHYGLIVMIPVLVATGLGARRLLEMLPDLSPRLALAAAAPGLATAVLLGGLSPALGSTAPPPAALTLLGNLDRCAAVIPAAAGVAADDDLAPALSSRARIVELPDTKASDYVAIDGSEIPPGWVDPARRRDVIASLPGQRRMLCRAGAIEVWGPTVRMDAVTTSLRLGRCALALSLLPEERGAT